MGSGGALNGKPIEQSGGMTRNIVKALDMAAEAIIKEESIPSEAIDLMSRKLMPTFLYTAGGNGGWRTQAKKFNANNKLYARPYIND